MTHHSILRLYMGLTFYRDFTSKIHRKTHYNHEKNIYSFKEQLYLDFYILQMISASLFPSPSLLTFNTKPFPASGSPCESEHVRAHERASLRAWMMRQCIYISLAKQEQWHAASIRV